MSDATYFFPRNNFNRFFLILFLGNIRTAANLFIIIIIYLFIYYETYATYFFPRNNFNRFFLILFLGNIRTAANLFIYLLH
jgi:hypothetical protein